ncbi:MAG: hypothetical protein AAGD11_07370 [Planctomycetota bacterium]
MNRLIFMLLTALLMSPSAATAQELLVNPGFDSGGTGWGSFGAAGFNDFFGGNEHASLFADNVGNSGGVFQTGIAGVAGLEYQFELSDTRIEANYDADLSYGLEFFLGDDSTKISEVLVALPDPGVEVNGGVFDMTAVAPAGTVFVRPIIKFDNVFSSGSQRNVFVFDASLTAVPEPSSFLLVGIACMASLCRTRGK